MNNPQQSQNKPNVVQQANPTPPSENPNYRVEVKRDLCIGAASCVAIAPETFMLDDENIAIVKNKAGNPYEAILAAAQACPTKAIYVYDKTGKQVWPE